MFYFRVLTCKLGMWCTWVMDKNFFKLFVLLYYFVYHATGSQAPKNVYLGSHQRKWFWFCSWKFALLSSFYKTLKNWKKFVYKTLGKCKGWANICMQVYQLVSVSIRKLNFTEAIIYSEENIIYKMARKSTINFRQIHLVLLHRTIFVSFLLNSMFDSSISTFFFTS